MSAQDNIEKTLRELHVLLSKSREYEGDPDYLIVNKNEMVGLLKKFVVCMNQVMDEYEVSKQSKEQALRKNRKMGEDIVSDAKKKAEDVYAASVIYTDDALKRILDIMQQSNDSIKAIFTQMEEQFDKERQIVSQDKYELKGYLQNLQDTDKYMSIIEDRNKRLEKEKRQREGGKESSLYANRKTEIKINKEYFQQQGIPLEEPEEQPEKTPNAAPEITVNLDSEYFKWKENGGKEPVTQDKTQEKKSFFDRFIK